MTCVFSLVTNHYSLLTVNGRGVRVVDRARLESVCTERYRGFESRPLRSSSKSRTAKNPEKARERYVCGPFQLFDEIGEMRRKTQKKTDFVSRIVRVFETPDFTGVS
jgi:hypothetical protein